MEELVPAKDLVPPSTLVDNPSVPNSLPLVPSVPELHKTEEVKPHSILLLFSFIFRSREFLLWLNSLNRILILCLLDGFYNIPQWIIDLGYEKCKNSLVVYFLDRGLPFHFVKDCASIL